MQSLPRNGSYFQRRKMYKEFPLHNLKSSVPIDWHTDTPPTYQRHRPIAKQSSEREYIRRIYDQRMENKIRQRYYGEQIGKIDGRDVLQKELEQFNTSKIINANHPLQTLQGANPQTPHKSPKSISRQQQEDIRKPIDNSQSEREGYRNDRDRRYSQRERSTENDLDRQVQQYPYRRQDSNEFQNKQLNNDAQRTPSHKYSPQYHPSSLNRGNSDLGTHPYPPSYYISSPSYKPQHYQEQQQYSYDSSRLYIYPQQLLAPNQKRPFRNALPDRLQQFLREKTKADRKSSIIVNLKDK